MQGSYPPSSTDAVSSASFIPTTNQQRQASLIQAVQFKINGDFQKALPLFEALVKQDVADACFHLGTMYQDGLGVEPNSKKAGEYYIQAMKLNEKAITVKSALGSTDYLDRYHLGRLLEAGYPFDNVFHTTIWNCYSMSSSLGNPMGSVALGYLIEKRDSSECDDQYAAKAYYNLAFSQGMSMDDIQKMRDNMEANKAKLTQILSAS